MSTFSDFLAVISQLPSNTEVIITMEWCSNHGLTVDKSIVLRWGQRIAKEYYQHGLAKKIMHPGGGQFDNKNSKNLRHYYKI